MNQRETSLTRSKNYKISKIGLLENDKKLIIRKLGLNNLSYTNLPKVKEKKNIYNKTVTKLNEQKRNSKESIQTQVKKKRTNISPKKIITPTPMIKFQKKIKFNNNPNATFSSNEIINNYNKYKKSLKHDKISLKKNLFKNNINNNSKSYSKLPIKPLINNKIMTNTSLNKKHMHLIKDIRSNDNTNSFKVNQTYNNETFKNNIKNYNKESPGIYSGIKLIKKIKIFSGGKRPQNKINISKSIPNLLFEYKNIKNKKKEQSIKIINNNILINKINNEKTENKYIDKIGQISPIKKCKISMNYSGKIKNEKSKSRIYGNVIKINIIKKRNKSMQDSKVKNISSYLYNINKNVEYNIKKNKSKKDHQQRAKLSESNDNSEDTKKESGLNLHKIFGDKTFINIDNNNIINEIISYNIKVNLNDYKNIHSPNINDLNASFNGENSSINHDNKYNDKKRHMSYFNNLNKNNDEENYSTKNENFSSVNENNDNKNYSKRCSKIITNLQDGQKNNDKNSGQTTSTNEKKITKDMNQQQPSYSSSQIKIRNEISFRGKNNMPNKLYKFIEDIINENKNKYLIDIRKILRLNDLSLFRLLSYSYDNYSSIISSNKLIKGKIYISLVHTFQHVIDDFKLKYGTFLKVLNFSFMPKVLYIKGNVSHLFNLVIECQIITKDIKKSFEIGCDYISYKKKYDNKWKFDVHKKEDIKLWLCTELDMVDNISKKFTYTSQVPSFSYQDIIKLQLNIFSKGNSIEPKSIEWSEPIISNTKLEVYQNTNFISPITYDQLRACEVETQILFWKKSLPEDYGGIVHEFEKIFEKFFEIKNIWYDVSKFYFFKIETIASKTGLIKQNKFSTFDINIIEYKDNIKNEIQCIYLMNSNFYSKTMDIRLGSYVTFYIIDMKR